MLLSIVCANVYPGPEPVEFLLRNLHAQTCQDFELVLVDAFYKENTSLVTELKQAFNMCVVHVPACEDKHVGRYLHWELYSNGLLLASNPCVLYHGVYRHLHSQVIETVVERASRGVSVVLHQIYGPAIGTPDIDQLFSLNPVTEQWHALQHSGFFSVQRDIMIHRLNGYNEALVNDHWVDCELSARARHLPLVVEIMQRGMIRFTREGGHYGLTQGTHKTSSGIGKPICTVEENPRCIVFLMNAFTTVRRIDGEVNRFVHNGFEWVRCPVCGTIGVEWPEAYINRLIGDSSLIRAPINVAGVGRNLAIIDSDLAGRDLVTKIEILSSSHDNQRYLQA